ncbi:hypothetical protein N7532_008697 [Penicillium argentinense]|uniref:Palmitoyltransferase n=1 Tax=Penicillium argentinense TaxID=1131581 RepID=A0A9W9K1W9_9EURO|nr:uncharacterized protein N7532_008697 [Penicillium argentinense]KAJ5090013.1 hypothetical protein N7532_008697 [Penicillium argentinense]
MMGSLRTIALAILAISAFTFIALFGRLPAFRKTPIALLHRAVWIYFPNGVAYLDSRLLGGRLVRTWNRSGSYILHENHPLVLIFFVGLLAIGEWVFLPVAWPRMSSVHHPWVPPVVIIPYILLYKCVMTNSHVTPENHNEEMKRYPFDQVLFHPGYRCSTCNLIKPARSKHCKFCRTCVSRQDHHCVWLMNCVGANNYMYFMSLLLSLSVLLAYGTCLGYSLLRQSLQEMIPAHLQAAMESWIMYFNIWAIVIQSDPRIGTITLLMLMTAPLAMAFLAYHTYLIWAGMTTNESSKWSDWKEDVEDGYVFKAHRKDIPDAHPFTDFNEHPWPVTSDQLLVTDDEPPLEGYILVPGTNRIDYRSDEDAPIDSRWVPVHSMKDIDNIYDLGFWNNLRDSAGLSVRRMGRK